MYWITASRIIAQALAERERGKPLHNWIFIDVVKGIIYFMRPTSKNSLEDHVMEVYCEFCPLLYRIITAYADWTSNGIVSSGTSGRAVQAFAPFSSQRSTNDFLFQNLPVPLTCGNVRVAHVTWFELKSFPPGMDKLVYQIMSLAYDVIEERLTGHDYFINEMAALARGHTFVRALIISIFVFF